jgi:hypothetical protein
LIVNLQSKSWKFLVAADHVAVNAVVAQGAEFIFILFIVLLVIALFVENMRAVVADHSLVISYRMVADVANQVADMSMVLK